MAILKFAQDVLDQLKRPDEGWYLVEFQNAKDAPAKPKPGKPQTTNMSADIILTKELATGKDVIGKVKKDRYLFNYEWWHMEQELIKAVLDVPSLEVLADKEIDMKQAFEANKVHGHVKHVKYENGQEGWEIDQWMPSSQIPF
jgi:hypothetical protein